MERLLPNEAFGILYSFRSYLGWQLEASGNELASWIHSRSLRVSRNDYLLRRLPSKEVSLMGIESLALVIFAWLMELSRFLEDNAGLLFFTSLLLVLWLSGVVTVVRRWRSE